MRLEKRPPFFETRPREPHVLAIGGVLPLHSPKRNRNRLSKALDCASKAADTGRKEACSINRVASQIGKYIRTFVTKKGAHLALADQPDFFKES